jgi:hypothetical protein
MAKSGPRRTAGSRRESVVTQWKPGRDAVRIVPTHVPKPVASVSEIAAARAAAGQDDLYDGRLRLAPASAQLSYRGGPLLTRAQVHAIYWGASWQASATAHGLRTGLDRFFADILVSPLMDQLAEYSVGARRIGRGKFLGSTVRTDGAPRGSITDTALRRQLRKWISARVVPATTAQSLYFIFLEPGIVSSMGGSRSCQSYCGYHNAAGKVYYAVMPYPSCAGCLGGMKVLDALTATSSHELCEAITDPVPGTGWYDDSNGEIGDICAWQFRQLGGHSVQLEWSNAQGRCG